jgi:hypothetical protein
MLPFLTPLAAATRRRQHYKKRPKNRHESERGRGKEGGKEGGRAESKERESLLGARATQLIQARYALYCFLTQVVEE